MTKQTNHNELVEILNKSFGDLERSLDKRFKKVDGRLDTLEKGQEDIKMRLDNVAYRFEIRDLEERVKLVEEKVGIAR